MSIVDEQNLQSTLRRGWYYGREAFRDWLLDKADELLRRRSAKRKNYHGREVREHGEAAARRLIAEGLASERLIPAELRALPKGDPRKARIAAKVRSTTTVPLQWLADQLERQQTSSMPADAMPQIKDYSPDPFRSRMTPFVHVFS